MKPSQFVSVNLPKPVSVNSLWRPVCVKGKPRLVCSAKYAAWKKEAAREIYMQKVGCVHGPYALTITVQAGLKCDLGNVEKAVSDALQTAGVVENDRDCQRIEVRWSPAIKGVLAWVVATREAA